MQESLTAEEIAQEIERASWIIENAKLNPDFVSVHSGDAVERLSMLLRVILQIQAEKEELRQALLRASQE